MFRSPFSARCFVLLGLTSVVLSCGNEGIAAPSGGPLGRERQLWEVTVKPHLQDDLWIDRDADDAGHALMIPLFAAFELRDPAWETQFSQQFGRFVEEGLGTPSDADNRNGRFHYFYLASWFLVLAKETGNDALIPLGLVDILRREVRLSWEDEPAWQWDRAPFPGGVRERIAWKMSVDSTEHSYYRAITDEEVMLFAVAANLRHYEHLTSTTSPQSSMLDEILATARTVIAARVVRQGDGGWLFQPGYWWDHPDWAYAGHLVKAPDIKPLPVPGIAEDASHSHRWALWLTSFAEADRGNRDYYIGLRNGLETQFFNTVYVAPSADFVAPRTRNYMDGHNGLYRWGYSTLGEGNGIGPYELSGTLTLGWWTFAGPRVRAMYADLATRFPLPASVLEVYLDRTTRIRHPLVMEPASYENGYKELTVRLAARVKPFVQAELRR